MGQHTASMLNQVVHLAIWLAILGAVFVPLERYFTLRAAGQRREGLLRDLFYYFLNNILPNAVVAFGGALIAVGFARLLPSAWHDFVMRWPMGLRALGVFVIGEIGYYWGHRWMHVSPLLWRFHAVHHAAEHIDWLANTRAHPIDMILSRMFALVPVYALGLLQPTIPSRDLFVNLVLIFTQVIGIVWSFFIHANVRWRFGWFETVLSTPAFHHWHHSNDRAYRDRNFASTLPILDRLFGTLHLPHQFPEVYGIDTPMSHSLGGQLLDPIVPRS